VVDLSTRKITSTIPLDAAYPQSVFINPDATLAWVTFPWNGSVEVIDLMTGARVASFVLDTAYSVAFNPTGTMAYLAAGEAIGSVEVIDASSYTLVKTVPAGAIKRHPIGPIRPTK
jgi:DNA-binding beta-propeller fold protein YncE